MDQPRPTDDDAAKFSRATRDLPAWAQLTPEEAADVFESVTGKPVNYGTNAAAVTALQKRLARLQKQRAKLRDLIEETPGREEVVDALAALEDEYRAAQDLFAQYQAQAKQQN